MAAACVCTRTPDKKPDVSVPDTDPIVLEITKAFSVDENTGRKDLEVFTAEPHPFGSARNSVVIDHLASRVNNESSKLDVKVSKQPFTATVPNPAAMDASGPVATTLERSGANLIATGVTNPSADCIVLLGSHFDSKEIAGFTYLGANDSGSSSVALIYIVNYLAARRAASKTECDIGAVWFDGEEAVLPNWNDGQRFHPAKIQDNTYGSRHFVSTLSKCSRLDKTLLCMPEALGGKAVVALILMDMIGSPDIQISRDVNSTLSLLRVMERGAKELEVTAALNPSTASIEDDHIPFRQAGIPALDIIDFNNLAYWHAPGDELEKISFQSIELASRLSIYTAMTVATQPKVFAESTE